MQTTALRDLGGKLAQIDSAELRERLTAAAERYAKGSLVRSDTAFDLADRSSTLLALSMSVANDTVTPYLLGLALGLLEHSELKGQEPVAWIVLVRLALNELNDPNPRLAAEAARFFRQTRDRDLSLYYRAQQLIKLLPVYQTQPLSNFRGILGSY